MTCWGYIEMAHQIASKLAGSNAVLTLLDAPNRAPPPFLVKPLPQSGEPSARTRQILAPPSQGRRKIWEFDANLHCSIIGTCLTSAELRHALGKLRLKEATTATEHDLHASGVLVAAKRHDGAKLLQKALDRKHRVAVNRFARAKTTSGVRDLWREAVQRGEIPGAYWAALTHPATDDALVREVFSEVHMLSHLVGAANRADIQRLCRLEAENGELQAKIERQQRQLRDAIVARDATIRKLNQALEARIDRVPEGIEAVCQPAWEALAADLKSRLERGIGRAERLDRQLAEARTTIAAERAARTAAEEREAELRREVEAMEAGMSIAGDGDGTAVGIDPLNATLLYVGGRAAQIGHLRVAAERAGAALLHHDGGIEERGGLLPGLVSRADAVLFPVDCVSHSAMMLVKRLCRQAGKPLLPLRSAGLAPFCAALKNPALCAAAG
jgi:hypothetical protein